MNAILKRKKLWSCVLFKKPLPEVSLGLKWVLFSITSTEAEYIRVLQRTRTDRRLYICKVLL